ncbi:MAG: hypothetical protein KDK39_15860 [Leptospiraceae bacterium]|nr:hypothetical protein [Leptospiraceae bacterium]
MLVTARNISFLIGVGLAIFLGVAPLVAGSLVLGGYYNPGYVYHTSLIVYNMVMGLMSLLAASLAILRHKYAVNLAILIAILHGLVLGLMLLVFREHLAVQSIEAMTLRTFVWLLISVLWRLQAGKV